MHYDCAGLKAVPEEDWFCEECNARVQAVGVGDLDEKVVAAAEEAATAAWAAKVKARGAEVTITGSSGGAVEEASVKEQARAAYLDVAVKKKRLRQCAPRVNKENRSWSYGMFLAAWTCQYPFPHEDLRSAEGPMSVRALLVHAGATREATGGTEHACVTCVHLPCHRACAVDQLRAEEI